jgi:apolipoprotein D and lipocalin family protein
MKLLRSTCAALALGLATLSLPAWAAGEQSPLQTIEKLDLQRYLGTWHEIARTPNWFQQKCAGESRAEYSLNPGGTLRVLNRCRMADGSLNEAVGEARRVGSADSAQLLVRFAPAWLSWLPMVWGDYWVIDLDPDYQLVAVSEPRREYLWVLARQPRVDERAYQALLQRLQHKGFDLSRLQRSPQS